MPPPGAQQQLPSTPQQPGVPPKGIQQPVQTQETPPQPPLPGAQQPPVPGQQRQLGQPKACTCARAAEPGAQQQLPSTPQQPGVPPKGIQQPVQTQETPPQPPLPGAQQPPVPGQQRQLGQPKGGPAPVPPPGAQQQLPSTPQQPGVPPKGIQQPVQTQQTPPQPPLPGAQQPPVPGQQRQLGQPKGGPAPVPPPGAQQQQPSPQPPATPQQPGVPQRQQPVQTQETPPQPPGVQTQPPAPGVPQGQPAQTQQPPQLAPAQRQVTPPVLRPGGPGQVQQPQQPGEPGQFGRPGPGAVQPPPAAAGITPSRGNVDQLRSNRIERRENDGRVVIQEPGGRVIVREGGRAFIRHDESERFRHFGGNHRFEDRGRERFNYVGRPGGYQIITVTDPNGHMLRRVRRGPDGREVVLINNAVFGAAVGTGFILALAAPQIRIPRERYIVDVAAAPPALLYETLDAPPVMPLERAYALDEIRNNVNLRDRVRRIDLTAITFDTGSWELAPEQFPLLEAVANGMRQVLARNPDAVFMVEGHTDAVGADVDNLSLSDRRAESVAVVLTEQFQISARESRHPGLRRTGPEGAHRGAEPRESPRCGPQHHPPARRTVTGAERRMFRARSAGGPRACFRTASSRSANAKSRREWEIKTVALDGGW